MPKFYGIGASEGVEIATIFKLEEVVINTKKDKITDVNKELRTLDSALAKTKKDIAKLKEISKTKLGEDKAAIFEAHEQILMDPTLLNEIKEMVMKHQINLAYAIDSVSQKYMKIFTDMSDAYFKERAADVSDVYGRLLKYVLNIPVIDLATINKEVIIVANDLTPSQTAQLNPKFVKGFACNVGGRTSHAAIMARSLEIPAVLGLKNITSKITNSGKIILDGHEGLVVLKPTPQEEKKYNDLKQALIKEKRLLQKYKDLSTKSLDGKNFLVEANIGTVSDIDSVLQNGAEGIGLFRSEFLYMDSADFPSEEEQLKAYKAVLQKMDKKIVVIRTLDIGGDKKLSYFKFPKEMNPFLGYRAIRMCLDKKEMFRTQLRALLRASAFGNLGIMFPMIGTVEEFKTAKKMTLEEKDKLIKKGIKVDPNVQIGMMIEVPAAALNANTFAQYADFFSIGTNDLIQYTLAADRMSEEVAYLYQPYNPSILRLIKMTIEGAHAHNKWVGMCGEVAGDIKAIPLLVGLGLDAFSMSATSMLRARKIIASLDSKAMKELVNKALQLETNKEVLDLVNKSLKIYT